MQNSVGAAVRRQTAGSAKSEFAPVAFNLQKSFAAECFASISFASVISVESLFENKADGVAVAQILDASQAESASGVNTIIQFHDGTLTFVFGDGDCFVNYSVERDIRGCHCIERQCGQKGGRKKFFDHCKISLV